MLIYFCARLGADHRAGLRHPASDGDQRTEAQSHAALAAGDRHDSGRRSPGCLFNKQAETTWRNPFVMGTMLIVVGMLMWIAENAGRKQRDLSSVNLADALAIGVAQALAVVPGCSRSGITITAGLFRNLTRESAARFSFLLSTPAIGGGGGQGALGHAQARRRPARHAEHRLSGGRGGQRRSPAAW